MKLRPCRASLYTHVISVPETRFRGKTRQAVMLRIPRHAVGKDCQCAECRGGMTP